MAHEYAPNSSAIPTSPYTTAFLSQRDLGLQVPINFVTTPGISLTSACFAEKVYEDEAAQACFSNLLAVGFRRFEVDLYWDEGRSLWSLCPVSLPPAISSNSPSSTLTNSTAPASKATLTSSNGSTGAISARQTITTPSTTFLPITNANASNGTGSFFGTILPTFSIVPNAAGETLVQLGPYTCSNTINIFNFLSQLLSYIQKTETTLDAHLLFIVFNIHAAASSTSPTLPAPSPTLLPGFSSLVGGILAANLSDYLYTPNNLFSDRANLNSSWYTTAEAYRPTSDYFATFIEPNGIHSTESGWPSESYIELFLIKRLLLQWGTIDSQMHNYNFTADTGVLFSQNYTESNKSNITVDNNGNITSGCYIADSMSNLSISSINSSWAVSTITSGDSSNIAPALTFSSRLTNCGISPILNATLFNSTADTNFIPYANFIYSSIWSWAPGEPKNYSSEAQDTTFNCAASKLESGGRWTVSDCSQKYFAACRANGQPYNWTFSRNQISYSDASQACLDPYNFAAPRTALENSFLTQAMQNFHNDLGNQAVWVDFNSMNVKGCWVTGGQNATCPYYLADDPLAREAVLVPTIASIILIVIAAIVACLKIVGHRQIRKKRRRRMNDGVFYEGIPS